MGTIGNLKNKKKAPSNCNSALNWVYEVVAL